MRFENPKKTVHFGSKGATTFIDGAKKDIRKAYIARHKANEDWSTINPGSASRHILWGDSPYLVTNIQNYINKFKIHDNR